MNEPPKETQRQKGSHNCVNIITLKHGVTLMDRVYLEGPIAMSTLGHFILGGHFKACGHFNGQGVFGGSQYFLLFIHCCRQAPACGWGRNCRPNKCRKRSNLQERKKMYNMFLTMFMTKMFQKYYYRLGNLPRPRWPCTVWKLASVAKH